MISSTQTGKIHQQRLAKICLEKMIANAKDPRQTEFASGTSFLGGGQSASQGTEN